MAGRGGPPCSPDDAYERITAATSSLPGAPRATFELTIIEVMVSGDLAVVRDTWTETTRRADGSSSNSKTFRSFEDCWIDGPEAPAPHS